MRVPKSYRLQRRGFSLIELLLVVALLGVLAALVLSGVSAARHAERALSCRNKVRTLSLACMLYHDTWRILPPLGIPFSINGHWPRCLPYLDGAPSEPVLLDGMAPSGTDFLPFPNPVFVTKFNPLFVCPAASFPDQNGGEFPRTMRDGSLVFERHSGPGSYAGNSGLAILGPDAVTEIGPFSDRGTALAALTQGLSHVVLVSELPPPPPVSAKVGRGAMQSWDPSSRHWTPKEVADACAAEEFTAKPGFALGYSWWVSSSLLGSTSLYCHAVPPGGWSCSSYETISSTPLSATYQVIAMTTAGSGHSGIVNAALADGSVQAISFAIDKEVWRRMGTIDGGSF